MSETQARPADPYVRFWIEGGTEVAMLNAADFRAAMFERDYALADLDHALADLARVTAKCNAMIAVVEAARASEDHFNDAYYSRERVALRAALASLDAQQEPS